MSYLILVRHGESMWNLANKFTGWVDVPLSEGGIQESLQTAKRMKNFPVDVAFTSKLERAQETLLLILAYQKRTGIFLHKEKREDNWALHPKRFDKNEIPIYSDEAINERYYGKLQGMNKDAARKKFGAKQVFIWRRSYDISPPGGECLKDVVKRSVPYFNKQIMPQLKKGKNVIVAAHGNSLRGIIKFIENIPDDKIPYLELPTGKPIIYEYSRGRLTRILCSDVASVTLKSKKKKGKSKIFKISFDRPIEWK